MSFDMINTEKSNKAILFLKTTTTVYQNQTLIEKKIYFYQYFFNHLPQFFSFFATDAKM